MSSRACHRLYLSQDHVRCRQGSNIPERVINVDFEPKTNGSWQLIGNPIGIFLLVGFSGIWLERLEQPVATYLRRWVLLAASAFADPTCSWRRSPELCSSRHRRNIAAGQR